MFPGMWGDFGLVMIEGGYDVIEKDGDLASELFKQGVRLFGVHRWTREGVWEDDTRIEG
jgi:hypothetical protein